MKRWPMWVALLYAVTLIALTIPAMSLTFIVHANEKIDRWALFATWQYWMWIVILMLNQWALLSLPVDLVNKRPAGKRSLAFQITASALSMGFLITGLAVGISEVLKGADSLNYINWVFFGVLGVSWIFWARVFATWSRKLETGDLVKRTCRALFKGSVLQLLVVVPCHIYVRSKDYCCAGFGTAVGLACGLAVMLVSFGPGVFFLYAEQWKKTKSEERR
ncbi:MAG: hypothetical protein V1673_04400 [Candidatus Omnitrophota bacterium]